MKSNVLAAAVLFAACQISVQLPAVAAEGLPGATVGGESAQQAPRRRAVSEQCQADPGKCRAEAQARREQWCKDNAEKCREVKARAAQHREQCKADPEKCRAEIQAKNAARFKRADADGNGAISRAEAQKSMPWLARRFDQIDANKDGQITQDELESARKVRAGLRRDKPQS